MKRTNATSITPPRAKRPMASSALDPDQNSVALAEYERLRTLVLLGLPESNAALPSECVQEHRKVATKIVALGGWKRERARLRSQQNMARLVVRRALTKEQLKKEYEERVRKRQQNSAPMAPASSQTKASTPVVEDGPKQKEASDNISKPPEQEIVVPDIQQFLQIKLKLPTSNFLKKVPQKKNFFFSNPYKKPKFPFVGGLTFLLSASPVKISIILSLLHISSHFHQKSNHSGSNFSFSAEECDQKRSQKIY